MQLKMLKINDANLIGRRKKRALEFPAAWRAAIRQPRAKPWDKGSTKKYAPWRGATPYLRRWGNSTLSGSGSCAAVSVAQGPCPWLWNATPLGSRRAVANKMKARYCRNRPKSWFTALAKCGRTITARL